MTTLEAIQVSVTEEDDVLVVGFGDGSGDDYLLFQHALDGPDEQDVRLGHDQPYVEYRDQAFGWYGHMTRVELGRDRLVVQMDAKAAAALETDGVIDVRFAIDDAAFARVRDALETTFGNRVYFSVRD